MGVEGWNRSGWGKTRGVDEEEERVSGCGGDGTGWGKMRGVDEEEERVSGCGEDGTAVGGGRREGWMRKRRG